MQHLTVSEMLQLYSQKGGRLYGGETVSQLDHALQGAALAEAAHQPVEMIVASLLHDIGHLLPASKTGEMLIERSSNRSHEQQGAALLSAIFQPSVTEPIRLHVAAKRYLCAAESGYWQELSAASKQSLEQQGGIFSADAAAAFIAQPYAAAAVQLRRWDDQAKIVGLAVPSLEHFAPMLTALQHALQQSE
jgi:phosphonate degradation associated HDIG domain protein